MKIRTSLVSNSSSASFIVDKHLLSQDQIDAIFNYKEESKDYGIPYADTDPWGLEEDDRFITGFTSLDNFDMQEYFTVLGILTAKFDDNH